MEGFGFESFGFWDNHRKIILFCLAPPIFVCGCGASFARAPRGVSSLLGGLLIAPLPPPPPLDGPCDEPP